MAIIIGISAFVFGVTVALIVSNIHRKPIGTLRVDRSDPDDGPYLFLELSENTRELMNQKYITLEVNVEDYISHK